MCLPWAPRRERLASSKISPSVISSCHIPPKSNRVVVVEQTFEYLQFHVIQTKMDCLINIQYAIIGSKAKASAGGEVKGTQEEVQKLPNFVFFRLGKLMAPLPPGAFSLPITAHCAIDTKPIVNGQKRDK